MAISVTMRSDQTAEFMARVENLTRHEVLVGVPSSDAGRQGTGPTNAMLAYIHEHGSPARNIPARPFMSQGMAKAQPAIVRAMQAGARAVTAGDPDAGMKALHSAGMVARNAIVAELTDPSPQFAPLSPRTIRGRLMRTQAGRRKMSKMLAMGKQMGYSSDAVLTGYQQGNWDTKGAGLNMRPLVDTGQLRASINYVVRLRPGQKAPGFISRTISAIGKWFKKG